MVTISQPIDTVNSFARNSRKNEYRSNANAFKHISSTGIWFDGYEGAPDGETEIENQLSIQNPQDWLLFIEDERLHAALSSLKPEDLEFVFVMVRNGYTQRQMAERLGVHQNAAHKRWRRIVRQIKKFF